MVLTLLVGVAGGAYLQSKFDLVGKVTALVAKVVAKFKKTPTPPPAA